jgi:hypothetical protein
MGFPSDPVDPLRETFIDLSPINKLIYQLDKHVYQSNKSEIKCLIRPSFSPIALERNQKKEGKKEGREKREKQECLRSGSESAFDRQIHSLFIFLINP